MIHFTLYSRSWCHLCDDMLAALQAELQASGREAACSIEVVDVDADEALVARYDELVPVLLARKNEAEPVQLCHYFLDVSKLKALLAD